MLHLFLSLLRSFFPILDAVFFILLLSSSFLFGLLTCQRLRWDCDREKGREKQETLALSSPQYAFFHLEMKKKNVYWMRKNSISSHANRNLKRFILKTTSNIEKWKEIHFGGRLFSQAHTHNKQHRYKAMEFFNLYSLNLRFNPPQW